MKVLIWEDPITRTRLEGMATIKRKLHPPDYSGLIWAKVQFDGINEPIVERFYNPKDIKKEKS